MPGMTLQELLHLGPVGVVAHVLDHARTVPHEPVPQRVGAVPTWPVPIWRNPALEALLGGPLEETGLTDAAVHSLVAQQARESEVLELKAQPYPGAPPGAPIAWTAEQELAKDVTALANTAGGLLLIGVEETGGAASAATPFQDDPEAVAQRLGRALVNHSAPVPRVAWIPFPAAAGGHYLAVVVPPSPLAPHAVTGQRGDSRRPLHWFVRDGADTRPVSEPEIADRYRTRFRGADDQQTRRERVAGEGREALGRSDRLWLWTAVVPHAPVPAVLDAHSVRNTTRWWQTEYGFASPLDRSLHTEGRPYAGPGRTIFTGLPGRADQDPTDPSGGAYVELHTDGSAFAATPVALNTGLDGGIGDTTLVDDLVVLVDACLSWTVRQAGAWGNADLLAGLRDGPAPDGELSQPAELVTTVYGETRRQPGTRRLDKPPTITITVDLTTADTHRGRLAATGSAAAAILQWFGLPEATQIAPTAPSGQRSGPAATRSAGSPRGRTPTTSRTSDSPPGGRAAKA